MPAQGRADIECEMFALGCATNRARKAGEDMLFTGQRDAPISIDVYLDPPID